MSIVYDRYHTEECPYIAFKYQHPENQPTEDCGCKQEE